MPIAFNNAEYAGDITGSLFWCCGLVYLEVRIYRRARRNAMLPGSTLINKDPRPYILYLRSFEDDTRIKRSARTTNGRIILERLVKLSFEEIVTDHLWGYGPVLALGNLQARGS